MEAGKRVRGAHSCGVPFAWHPHTNGGRGTSTPPVCPHPFLWPLPSHTPAPLGVQKKKKKGGGGGTRRPCARASPGPCPCACPPPGHTPDILDCARQTGEGAARQRARAVPLICGAPCFARTRWEGGGNGGGAISAPVRQAGRGQQGWVAPSPTWWSSPVRVLHSCARGTRGGCNASLSVHPTWT
jgi:hypothetical protein